MGQGELLGYLKGWVSEGERLKISERSGRGKREKARRGETVGVLRAPLGFRYTPDRKALEADVERMPVVRRISEMAASGNSLLAPKKALERDGVPTVTGNRFWHVKTLQRIVNNDAYRTRSVKELRAILPAGVTDKLDPGKRYGVWWYGRKRHHQQYGRELGLDGQRRYHEGSRVEDLLREQWVAIPIPDCGLPPDLVDAARTARNEYRKPATTVTSGSSSGVSCAAVGCGRTMSDVTGPPRKNGTRPCHYRCYHRVRNGPEACPNGKHHRAEKIEAEAWEKLSALLKDPKRLRIGIERMIEEKRAALRLDPTHELHHRRGELEKIERMRSGYLYQQAEGIISMSDPKGKLAALDERRAVAECELGRLTHHQEQIAELEREAEALLELYGYQAREGLDLYTPQDRHDAYKALGIRVKAHPDGSTELTGSQLAELLSDKMRMIPNEEYQALARWARALPSSAVSSSPDGDNIT